MMVGVCFAHSDARGKVPAQPQALEQARERQAASASSVDPGRSASM